jgi:copper chaperone NosL
MKFPIKPLAFAALALSLAALAACRPSNAEPQPPDLAYGQDLCDACGMLVDDAHFAAATVTDAGRAYKFDDLGEMITYHQDHADIQVRAWFVHDYNSQAWVRAEGAFFVHSSQLQSPMGSGLAAFAQHADADAAAGRLAGEVFNWDELRAALPTLDSGHMMP